MKERRGEASEADSAWVSRSERGSHLALASAAWCFRRLGPGPLRLLIPPIAAYYTLFAGSARRASRAYLAQLDRARGVSPAARSPWRDAYRHFYSFADLILDRFCFWTGAYDDFTVEIHGREHMERLFESGRSALLVGAHLGSFDVLRVISRDAGVRVNVLMFTANAERINNLFRTLDPGSDVRLIPIDPTSVDSAFVLRRCLERDEFVAVLSDRVYPGGRSRVASANFLGRPALFPQGPFLLAAVMGLPVVLSLAIKTGPYRYDVHLETLAEAGRLPAAERDKAVQERIEAFAAKVGQHCLTAPYQWFNFYDFWAEAEGAEVDRAER